MRSERPSSLIAIAVLNLALGGLGALGFCGSSLFMLAVPTLTELPSQTDPNLQPMPKPPPELIWTSVSSHAVLMLLAVGCVIVGIGLLRLRPWSRRAGILLSGLVILATAADLFVDLILIAPQNQQYAQAVHDWQQAARSNNPGAAAFSQVGGQLGATFGVILSFGFAAVRVGFALAQLVVLTRPPVRAVFAAAEREDGQPGP